MKLEFESTPTTVAFADSQVTDKTDSVIRGEDVSQILRDGIKAAQEGKRADARQLLLQVTEAEPENENAWLWLASISEYPEELLGFLNNILAVNPKNTRALEWSQATKSMLATNFVQRGIDASNEAKMELAKQCFQQAITHDGRNEMAWLWMASISNSSDEKITHLQKVLDINPNIETANASLLAAKNRFAESLLQKANRAAISGERQEADEMLKEVMEQNPDLEEAWILKSYLAESFSEKVTAFEKVLSLNPENEAAISGLASLRAMMAKTESRKAEQSAMLTNLVQENSDESASASNAAENDNDKMTGKLEFSSDLSESVSRQFESYQFESQSQPEESQSFATATQNFDNHQMAFESDKAAEQFSTESVSDVNVPETTNFLFPIKRTLMQTAK